MDKIIEEPERTDKPYKYDLYSNRDGMKEGGKEGREEGKEKEWKKKK